MPCYFFNKFKIELHIIPKTARTINIQADINPAAQNVEIKSWFIGKNNKAIHGKIKIKPRKILNILFLFFDLTTEYTEENIAAAEAIQNKPNVRYKPN